MKIQTRYSYCVYSNKPVFNVDSIIIFQNSDIVCVYRVRWPESAKLENDLIVLGFTPRSYEQSEYLIKQFMDRQRIAKASQMYSSEFSMANVMLKQARKEEISLAYRAARTHFFNCVRELEKPDSFGDLLNERQNNLEGAKAMFDVLRRVFETEVRPIDGDFGCAFDGAPEEVINSIQKYECGTEGDQHGDL